MKTMHRLLAVVVTLLISLPYALALEVPHVFGDHMVLQTGMPIPVWGWAKPGEEVTVTFANQSKKATAAAGDGRWQVELDPLPVSTEPEQLTISASDTVVFKDILVGEVWLCAGQSNMQKPVGTWRGQPEPTIDYQKELAAAKYPLIRMMNIEISNPAEPRGIST